VKRLLFPVVCCLLVFGAACTKDGTRPAATVNGTNIPTQALVDELNAIAGNSTYLGALKSQADQSGTKVEGATTGSFDVSFATQTLRSQIFYALVRDEVAHRGLTADDACTAAARNAVEQQVGFSDAAAGKTTLAAFPQAYQDTLLQRYTDVLLLESDLAGQTCGSEDAAKSFYDANPDKFVQTCGSVIAVADQAAADAAQARLQTGEDFATVASAVSTDTSAAKGGDIGCVLQSQLPAELTSAFFDTAVGAVSAPVDYSGQVFLVKPASRQQAALDDVRSQAEELAASQSGSALQSFVQKAVGAATITVDPRYGVWNPSRSDIDPPASASASSSDSGASLVPPDSSS
jgi:parvulin-like peptidyl-prolyl isomerase